MTGLFLKKFSKLGPCRPRGSSGGMNLKGGWDGGIENLLTLTFQKRQDQMSVVIVIHSLVVDEGIHEQPLVDELLPLRLLVSQVSVVVVGDDDAVRLVGQLDNEAVVVANHAATLDAPRRGEDEDLLLLEAAQDLLICVWRSS